MEVSNTQKYEFWSVKHTKYNPICSNIRIQISVYSQYMFRRIGAGLFLLCFLIPAGVSYEYTCSEAEVISQKTNRCFSVTWTSANLIDRNLTDEDSYEPAILPFSYLNDRVEVAICFKF